MGMENLHVIQSREISPCNLGVWEQMIKALRGSHRSVRFEEAPVAHTFLYRTG